MQPNSNQPQASLADGTWRCGEAERKIFETARATGDMRGLELLRRRDEAEAREESWKEVGMPATYMAMLCVAGVGLAVAVPPIAGLAPILLGGVVGSSSFGLLAGLAAKKQETIARGLDPVIGALANGADPELAIAAHLKLDAPAAAELEKWRLGRERADPTVAAPAKSGPKAS